MSAIANPALIGQVGLEPSRVGPAKPPAGPSGPDGPSFANVLKDATAATPASTPATTPASTPAATPGGRAAALLAARARPLRSAGIDLGRPP